MSIKKHPQYTLNDYRYFKATGWSDAAIIQRWDQERAQGKSPCEWNTTVAKNKLRHVVG